MKKRAMLISVVLAIVAMCIFCGFILFRISHHPTTPDSTAEISQYESKTTEKTDSSPVENSTAEIETATSADSSSNVDTTMANSSTALANTKSVETNTKQNTYTSRNNTTNTPTNHEVPSNNVTTNRETALTTSRIISTIESKKSTAMETYKTTFSSASKTSTIKSAITSKSTTSKTSTSKTTSSSTTETTTTTATEPPLTPVDVNSELFGQYYGQAEELLSSMTLEEKVSQMFLASYPGYSTALKQVQSNAPGGYVLFAYDFQYHNKNSIRNELNNLKSNSKYGLFLGADEEGGTVVRVSKYAAFRSTRFKSPQDLFKQGGLQAIFDEAAEKASLLLDIGLNYNLAPVVDMPKNPYSYIYSRTLGQDAETTAEFSAGVVNTMNAYGMLATLKHFPGYGDNVDTHTGIAIDTRDKSTFENEDFLPFISGIQAGVPMIMVNHNIINCMDSSKPASLSEEVHRVLRYDLGFSGIIMTDALTMGAIKNYASNGEAAVQAVLCGNDMIATTDFLNQKQEVLRAVEDGRIPEETINNAVRRILACKYSYGLIQ